MGDQLQLTYDFCQDRSHGLVDLDPRATVGVVNVTNDASTEPNKLNEFVSSRRLWKAQKVYGTHDEAHTASSCCMNSGVDLGMSPRLLPAR